MQGNNLPLSYIPLFLADEPNCILTITKKYLFPLKKEIQIGFEQSGITAKYQYLGEYGMHMLLSIEHFGVEYNGRK